MIILASQIALAIPSSTKLQLSISFWIQKKRQLLNRSQFRIILLLAYIKICHLMCKKNIEQFPFNIVKTEYKI